MDSGTGLAVNEIEPDSGKVACPEPVDGYWEMQGMASVKTPQQGFALNEGRVAWNGLASHGIGTTPVQTISVPIKEISYARVKRALDIVLSVFLIVLLSPLFLIAALAVRFTSRGPIIFKQIRVGAGGRHFTCYKFRSMCVDAENKKHDLAHLNEANGPVFKIKHDPRVTPVGRLMRKLSLDELPQFFNVLKGEMSIVGPRPPVPHEVAQYGERELKRLSVQPGVTCLWQISGRSNISFDHWMELDLLYIETMSFWGDVAIFLKTIPAVVFARGAH